MSAPAATMRAVGFSRFGGPDVLEVMELPRPAPGPGEVLVRVAASTVNPTDILMRSGKQAAMMADLVPPYVAGFEFAGRVAALGEAVTSLSPDQLVMGSVNARRPGRGAHADYIVVPADTVVGIHAGADPAEAATVPMNGLTAKLAVATLGLKPGETVLVTGGAGVLAGYVVPLAKASGLVVVADAGPDGAARVTALGTDFAVPRGGAMADAVRSLCPNGVDGMIDTALLGADAAALVRDGGSAVAVRMSHVIDDPRLRSSYVSFADQVSNTADLGDLARLWRDGALVPRVAMRLPMRDAARAHALTEVGGMRGRIVLLFDEE